MALFKIQFDSQNIRRFRTETCPTYVQFLKVLAQKYPSEYNHKTHDLGYLDEDADLIKISRQEEWEEMLVMNCQRSTYTGAIKIVVVERNIPRDEDHVVENKIEDIFGGLTNFVGDTLQAGIDLTGLKFSPIEKEPLPPTDPLITLLQTLSGQSPQPVQQDPGFIGNLASLFGGSVTPVQENGLTSLLSTLIPVIATTGGQAALTKLGLVGGATGNVALALLPVLVPLVANAASNGGEININTLLPAVVPILNQILSGSSSENSYGDINFKTLAPVILPVLIQLVSATGGNIEVSKYLPSLLPIIMGTGEWKNAVVTEMHNQVMNSLVSNEFDKAKELLTQILQLNPNDSVALYNLACADSLLGNIPEALQSLSSAMEVGVRDIQQMLEDPKIYEKYTSAFGDMIDQLVSSVPTGVSDTEAEKVVIPQTNWEIELNTLNEMGFSDDIMLSQMLNHYNGDIGSVISELINTQL
eukprot:TRINITY_DN12285_c0_g1_i1.p1 TRINITY_DN12285_c0_g1~~TRINITY_DN12285_c0_g1_i1.p1  ORF type:complete len:490 (-),score=107.58 TRINITY_DN12285_c0_g1_i1:52-1467(-)